jgi:adenine phosphoribosyltransferase
MAGSYTLRICGLSRQLPLSYISKKTQLANFSVLGDVELVDCLADNLAAKLKSLEFDYLVALEVKIVPLVHGIAKRLGHQKFVVCRKSVKPYMEAPIILKPLAHFPKHVKPLVIDGKDARLIKGKRVVVIDTVISTGVTMRMMKKLLEKVGATPVKLIAVLRQGEQFDHFENLLWLAEIPVFKIDS